jgi:hypothetical protein
LRHSKAGYANKEINADCTENLLILKHILGVTSQHIITILACQGSEVQNVMSLWVMIHPIKPLFTTLPHWKEQLHDQLLQRHNEGYMVKICISIWYDGVWKCSKLYKHWQMYVLKNSIIKKVILMLFDS